MDKTIFKTTQYKNIVDVLITQGPFAISDIEKGNNLSREQIGKILQLLNNKNALTQTAKAGAGVKYKLTKTTEGITFLLKNLDQVTIQEISSAWDVSIASAKKYIKKFVDEGIVEKIGKPPKKINYILAQQSSIKQYSSEQEEIIERNFTYITADGQLFDGIKGFEKFIINKYGEQSPGDIDRIAQKYLEIYDEYYNLDEKNNLIDATNKFIKTFQKDTAVQKVFYRDFDQLPIFEKTQLYQLTALTKTGHRDIELMMKIVNKIQNSINQIIDKYQIEAVGFIPPTVMRKTQLITFIKKRLNLNIDQKIEINKVNNLLPIPQKELKKIKDRKLNAKNSITINSTEQYESVLLIDDVVGSGATINETAKKIISQDITQKVYAFTIVGSAKPGEFEIIPE